MPGAASQYLGGGAPEEEDGDEGLGPGGEGLSPHAWLGSARGFAALARHFRTRAVLLHTSDIPRFAPRDSFRGVPEAEAVRLLQTLTTLTDSQIFDVMDLFDPMQKGGVCLHEFFLLVSALAVSSAREAFEYLYLRGLALHRLVSELPAGAHWQALCTVALLLGLREGELRRHCLARGLTPRHPVTFGDFEEVLFLAVADRHAAQEGGGALSALFRPPAPAAARPRASGVPCCCIF